MENIKQRAEQMLFLDTTTGLTDYRAHKIKPLPNTQFRKKPKCVRVRPPALKNMHTLFDWKTGRVPFHVLHKPRPHIDIDPTKPQQAYFKPSDEEKDQSRRTRPRLVMTPAFSLDDIEDPQARKVLIDEIYISETMKCTSQGIRPYFRVAAPIPDHPANANPIKLPKLVPPKVHPEWRMETLSWDKKQLRWHCDPTERFWLTGELKPYVINIVMSIILMLSRQATYDIMLSLRDIKSSKPAQEGVVPFEARKPFAWSPVLVSVRIPIRISLK